MKKYIVCYMESKINSPINQIEIYATCRTYAFAEAKHILRKYLGSDNFTHWVYAYVNRETGNHHCFCTFDGKEL